MLYIHEKSYVKYGDKMSDTSFKYNIGLRQGEQLSPVLFAMYINDFENFICTVYYHFMLMTL